MSGLKSIFLITKDCNATSLFVAACPDVAVNLILGLPFMKATGMTADFVDNVCETNNLQCNPFPINLNCALKSIPVFQDCTAATMFHGREVQSILHILSMLKSSYEHRKNNKWLNIIKPSPEGKNNPRKCQATPSRDTLCDRVDPSSKHWIPPDTLEDNTSNYHNQILGDLGYM